MMQKGLKAGVDASSEIQLECTDSVQTESCEGWQKKAVVMTVVMLSKEKKTT